MIRINRSLLIALAGGVLLAQSLVSRAVTFTLQADPTLPANSFASGISSDNNKFFASLTQFAPVTFNNFSNVSYGLTQIGGGAPNTITTDTFSSKPANFTFDVIANGFTNVFLVNGEIDNGLGVTSYDDTTGNGSTNAFFKVNSLTVTTISGTTVYTGVASSPNAGRPSLVASNVQFGTTFANIYVEQANGLTAPGSFSNLTVGGYIGVTVPEPGSVALLVGTAVSGAGFLMRRRRARKA